MFRGLTQDGKTYLYAKNLQGDIVAIVNEAGEVEVRYQYGPWGEVDGNDAVTGNHELAELNPFTYRGYQYDQETGLYYLQSRYYNPEWKRFLNADVYTDTCIGILGSNMFDYCNNNPIFYYDPEGKAPTVIIYYDDFTEQANYMKKNGYKNKNVYMYKVTKIKDFINVWNNKLPSSIKDVHLYLHGAAGVLYFLKESFYTKDFTKLKKRKISGKVYLNSCQGGTTSAGGSVASAFASKVVPQVYVRAVVNGFVYYRAWNQPFARWPLTKEKGAYWADFYYGKYKGKWATTISPIGKKWRL